MTNGSEPQENEYDVVVVGSGIGGVTAAALLARAGRKVLLVERQAGPGGYARAIRRGPYVFDPAVHVTGQGKDGQLYDGILRYLGVRDRCTMLPVDPLYTAVFPDFKLQAALGIENYIAAFVRHFPGHAEEIRRFIELCRDVHLQAHEQPPRIAFKNLDDVMAQYPLPFQYRKATVAEVLDEYVTDNHLKAVLTTPWPYLGLPPSRLSFLTFCEMLFGYVVPGPSYCQGSFEMLVNALVTALEQNGGELLLNTRVNRILTEDGLVAGVVLDGGKEIRTSTVISNVDAVQTFEELVGAEHLPASFMRRLRRMEPSFSAFVLYLATTLDMRQFEATHETFLYKHWDHDQTYRDILDGKPGGMWISVPTLIDPSIAPAGEHIVIMKSLACYDIGVPWDQAKERFTDTMLGNLDAVYPGIRDHLTFMEVATPLSLENYTLNQHGAIYGWEYTPEQTGSKRLNHVTPIEGLYLSSHWTQPGAASLRVFVSGIHTAQLVLARAGMEEVARSFRHPDLPPAV